MSVKTNYHGEKVVYDFYQYENGCFLLKNEDEETIKVRTPLKLDNDFKDKNFDVFFLAKKNIKENEVFQVFNQENRRRIGWLIPVNALSSDGHDYVDNPHFLKYAYVGIQHALIKLDDSYYSCLPEDSDEIMLCDIFHESTALLIISKETLEGGMPFDFDRALPCLFKYGYVKLGTVNPDDIKLIIDIERVNKLNINFVSSEIDGYHIINELLHMSVAYEDNTVFKFFLIYQIIELLMEVVYKNEHDIIIDKIINIRGDISKTKDLLGNISESLSEKNRISLLIKEYSCIESSLSEIKGSCHLLLDAIGRPTNNVEFSNYFYPIRNFIFHQYRDFPVSARSLLNDVVYDLIELLPLMLSTFKRPTN